jgi:hypothetical protein
MTEICHMASEYAYKSGTDGLMMADLLESWADG